VQSEAAFHKRSHASCTAQQPSMAASARHTGVRRAARARPHEPGPRPLCARGQPGAPALARRASAARAPGGACTRAWAGGACGARPAARAGAPRTPRCPAAASAARPGCGCSSASSSPVRARRVSRRAPLPRALHARRTPFKRRAVPALRNRGGGASSSSLCCTTAFRLPFVKTGTEHDTELCSCLQGVA